jgi:hypothetical protein
MRERGGLPVLEKKKHIQQLSLVSRLRVLHTLEKQFRYTFKKRIYGYSTGKYCLS